MKIRYKLSFMFIFIIIAAALPLSLYNLLKQEEQRLAEVHRQGSVNAKIMARFGLSVIMMNGGDLAHSGVDLRDMMVMLEPLSAGGLVYADVIMLAARPGIKGAIVAGYRGKELHGVSPFPSGADAAAAERALGGSNAGPCRIKGIEGPCIEFLAVESLPGDRPFCAGRVIYSRDAVLGPIAALRRGIFLSTGAAVGMAALLGLLFSGFITRPIRLLVRGVERLGGGDLGHQLTVPGRDEFLILANTFNDMARMIKLEIDQVSAANEELRRLDRLKDDFLANMSHELRTPLYAMIGIAESLSEGAWGGLPSEATRNLLLIVSSGKRLAGLVNDILDFSRLKHRDITLRTAPVNVHSVALYAASLMAPLASRKGIAIVNTIPPDGWWASADGDRLQQVLINLLGNAVKFTHRGEVLIEASRDSGGMLSIAVSDTGIGIPEERGEQVFNPFEQGDGSVARVYGGTGLGLAITRRLVELHGGSIRWEPRRDGGTRFIFTLPACEPGAPAGAGAVPPFRDDRELSAPGGWALVRPAREGSEWRILVVDDEQANLQVMVNQLAMEGYGVITASSGDEALEVLDAERVDLVVLDVMLPRMSGFEVCVKIRETRPSHELPVLMLTARNSAEDVAAGLEAGASDYLSKPVGRIEFLARVKALLSLQKSFRLHGELALIKRDLQIAHDIQNAILSQDPTVPDGIRVAFRYSPMTELGGDFYDIRMVAERSMAVLVADVSGHGIPAAFICAMFKIAYELNFFAGGPSALMERLNRVMSVYLGTQFITACFAIVDLDAMVLSHSSAGHWPIILQGERGTEVLEPGEGSMPLGWDPDEKYRTLETPLAGADRIVFYTDGIVEARNGHEELFGAERFHRLIEEGKAASCESLCDAVMKAIEEWEGDSRGDDVTLIVADLRS